MKKQKRIVVILTVILLVLAALIAALLLFGGRNKEGYEYQMSLGKKLMEEEKYEEALYCFEQAMEIEPKREEPYMCMADVYELQGKFDKMAEILRLGCERAKAAELTEQYERLAKRLSEAEAKAKAAGQTIAEAPEDPENPEESGSQAAPEAVKGEELFKAYQVADLLLDWKINEADVYDGHGRFFYHHNNEDLLAEAKNAGNRLDFLLRCFSGMEILYPGGIEDLAGNYGQMESYFEEQCWTPFAERPSYRFTDWTAALDLDWVISGNRYEGTRYSVPHAFYLEEFNRMLEEVFGGAVPALTVEELSDYTEFSEHIRWPFFLYDSTHGVVCRLICDNRTGGDWEPENMYHNYIVSAEQAGETITLQVQKLSIDTASMYGAYGEQAIGSWEMTKEQYLAGGGNGRAFMGEYGQILAVDGKALTPLMPIHSYLIDFEDSAYEDMECIERKWNADGTVSLMSGQEVFEKLQANSAALLTDPGAYGPYFAVGNTYEVILEKESGYYRVVSVTKTGAEAPAPEEKAYSELLTQENGNWVQIFSEQKQEKEGDLWFQFFTDGTFSFGPVTREYECSSAYYLDGDMLTLELVTADARGVSAVTFRIAERHYSDRGGEEIRLEYVSDDGNTAVLSGLAEQVPGWYYLD